MRLATDLYSDELGEMWEAIKTAESEIKEIDAQLEVVASKEEYKALKKQQESIEEKLALAQSRANRETNRLRSEREEKRKKEAQQARDAYYAEMARLNQLENEIFKTLEKALELSAERTKCIKLVNKKNGAAPVERRVITPSKPIEFVKSRLQYYSRFQRWQ